jgi:alpha-2-macroglobulin
MLLTRLIPVLFILLLAASSAGAGDLPPGVTDTAASYRSGLAEPAPGRVDPQDRQKISDTAAVLSRIGDCRRAVDLRRLLLAGPAGFGDWEAQARDAICARNWQEAVGAAHQAYAMAGTDSERFRSLRRLGAAMQEHWRFDNADVLAVYRAAQRYGADPQLQADVDRLTRDQLEARALRLERIDVARDGAEPSFCLQFSSEMAPPLERAYGDFIRTEPRFDARFRQAAAYEICVDGGEYGKDYRLVVLAGLTDAGGRELRATREESVSAGDRAPSLRFQSRLYVLPRNGGGVPLHAINAPGAALTLYRVDERNLLAPELRELFGTDLGAWAAQGIENELGARVWSGSASWDVEPNREQRIDLPLADRLQSVPGVYVLDARLPRAEGDDDYDPGPSATQWVVVSDLGVTTYRGRDGLTVAVRGLADAAPREGVQLQLLARNNRHLAEARTDATGFAWIPAEALRGRGGEEPVMLFAATDDGDFNFLDVSRSPFDLSDRGVAGRAHPGPLDAFLYTERGVYRPGELVNLGILLRDDAGAAAPPLPLTLRLVRPDDTVAWEDVVRPEAAGGAHRTLRLPGAARTGRWKVVAHVDPEAAPVGQTAFQVQAILPPRLEARFEGLPEEPLAIAGEIGFGLQADYLFGAPAAGLAVRSEVWIGIDPNPFARHPGFRFGPLDTGEDRVVINLADAVTDDGGNAPLSMVIDRVPGRQGPLRAELRGEVVDVDGRVVTATAQRAVDTGMPLIGLRVAGDTGPEGHVMLNEGSEARFEILAVNARGEPLAATGLEYRVVEERIQYQWYREFGQWQYRREVRERDQAQGTLDLVTSELAVLAFSLDAGRYRLDVRDPATGALGSARVQLGWGGTATPEDTPDRLRVTHDRSAYLPGSEALLSIEGTFDGPGQVVIATDQVLEVLAFALEEGRAQVRVPAQAGWGAGAYALVTAFRPDDAPAGLGPRRAIGVAWLALDPEPHTLAVELDVPERMRPWQTLEVGVTIANHRPGEQVFLTLAAVDDGLLQLTAHPQPRPAAHFFGQRRLGLDIRDLYGRLLDGRRGQAGRIGSGAGAPGVGDGLEPPVTILSLFSGVLPVDEHGRARFAFDLPQFEGRVRLHAVAWSDARVGHATGSVTVRDPVVLQASLPRFLAQGDRSTATVTLFNAEGAGGDHLLHWRSGAALTATEGSEAFPLARGERRVVTLPVQAERLGRGELLLELEGPDDLSLQRSLALAVQPAFARDDRRQAGQLPQSQSVTLGGRPLADLIPETVSAQLTLDTRPQWDVAGLVRQLDLYPYGCLEQVTSRAFPLLDLPALLDDSGADAPDPQRLPEALAQVLDKQLDNGGFTLWGGPGEADDWVSVYALDLLGEARGQGVEVPDFAWQRGLRWLRALAEFPETHDASRMAAQSYGLYVLARNGAGRPETARYLLEVVAGRLPGGLAAAQLGAALALDGDPGRAGKAFALAGRLKRSADLRDYGSALRDQAEILRLAKLHAPEALDLGEAAADLAAAFNRERWLSTQEQAALVRTAAALTGEGRRLDLRLGDLRYPEADGPLLLRPDPDSLLEGLALENLGDAPLWYALLGSGNPAEAPAREAQGLRIERQLYNLDGATPARDAIVQGAVLVVVLEGEALEPDQRHQLLIVDPIPAGFEADSPGLEGSRALEALGWLGETSATLYTDALDDRFVAALDLERDDSRSFRVAYIVRAVAPGDYRLGPPFVEDMYRPRFRARGDSGWVHVQARP